MKKHILLLALVSLALISCRVEGCMDANAENHNNDANVDDGTCYYESSIALYFDNSTKTKLAASGVTRVNFYMDGVLQGGLNFDEVAYNGYKDCDSERVVAINQRYTQNSKLLKVIEVKNQLDQSIDALNVEFTAGLCSAIEFDY